MSAERHARTCVALKRNKLSHSMWKSKVFHTIILFVEKYRGRKHCYDQTQPSFSIMSAHQHHNSDALSMFRLNLEIFMRLHTRRGDSV